MIARNIHKGALASGAACRVHKRLRKTAVAGTSGKRLNRSVSEESSAFAVFPLFLFC
jgi:hypothetical protein